MKSDLKFQGVSRRDFIRGLGGGIVIFFGIGSPADGAEAGRAPGGFNAYLRIGADGRVTCFTGKIEMGQGVITSLAQMLADELEVSLDAVDMVMGDTDRCPHDDGTWGSMSTPYFGPVLRAAAAEARMVLRELAAEHLKLPAERLIARDGLVSDRDDAQKRVAYAELAKGKAIGRQLSGKPDLKAVPAFKVIGKSVLRRDAREKVTGRAQYTGDIRVAGMVYARVLRPAAHGAKLRSLDTSGVGQIEGAEVVRDGELVAVLHKLPDAAAQGVARLRAEYDLPEGRFDDESVFQHFLDHAGDGQVVQEAGALASGQGLAQVVVEENYFDGYKSHAPIETHTALAQFEGDRVTVWASTQTPFGLRGQIAGLLKCPAEKVRVIVPFVGGGFGGKISNGQALQAVRLARIAKKPVQLTWSREDEFFYDTFRPAAAVKIKAGLSEAGKIAFWDYGVYGAGGRGAACFYSVPHLRTRVFEKFANGESMHLLPTGPWRAPDNSTNSFARESHLDVLAARAKVDPVEFRLKHLTDARMRRVLEAAARKFGWTPAPGPSGRGMGVACGSDVDVPVTLMAEVSVDRGSGQVQVKRVLCAQDMGLVINPEGARLQAEGCVTMGLGYALTEDVRFNGGRVLDQNFDTYELPRFSSVPDIETVLIPADDSPARGGGEPGIICMGAVIANAIFDAVGARVHRLPMTPERVKQAIADSAVPRA
jgi:isoquinoline 1-oxidoreductase